MIDNKTQAPLTHYIELYKTLEPSEISARISAPYCNGVFKLNMLGKCYEIPHPGFKVDAPPAAQILMLRYLTSGVFAPPTGRFSAYRDLPWGGVYDSNFQGRCIMRLSRKLGGDTERFARQAEALGGVSVNQGDAAFDIPFMPHLMLRVVLWRGDDEVPASAQILFSDNFCLAFSAEDLAAVGDLLVEAL